MLAAVAAVAVRGGVGSVSPPLAQESMPHLSGLLAVPRLLLLLVILLHVLVCGLKGLLVLRVLLIILLLFINLHALILLSHGEVLLLCGVELVFETSTGCC